MNLLLETRNAIPSDTIAAGRMYTVGLKSNGTVRSIGYNKEGQRQVSGWKNIVAISDGRTRAVGVVSDGTVVAVGIDSYEQCDVSKWTDIRTTK